MNSGIINISSAIFKIIIGAAVLFLFLRAIYFFFPFILKQNKHKRFFVEKFPVFEFFLWVLFIVWSSEYFMKTDKFLFGGFIIVVLSVSLWGSWFALKDYISGLVFRTSSGISAGDTISTDSFKGKVEKFNFRTLSVDTGKNKTIAIPYSKLLNREIKQNRENESFSGTTLIIDARKKGSASELIRSIKNSVILLPWSSAKQNPELRLISENEDFYKFELTFLAIKDDYKQKTLDYLRKKFY